jgi:hypothetical protein
MHPILGEITDDSERATLLAWTLWEQESGAIRAKLYRTLDGRFFEARSPSEGPDVPWDIVPLSSDIEVFAFLWAEKVFTPASEIEQSVDPETLNEMRERVCMNVRTLDGQSRLAKELAAETPVRASVLAHLIAGWAEQGRLKAQRPSREAVQTTTFPVDRAGVCDLGRSLAKQALEQ